MNYLNNKNRGVFDFILIYSLTIYEQSRSVTILEIIQKDFLYYLFFIVKFILNFKDIYYRNSLTKLLKYASYIILSMSLFINRKNIDVTILHSINFLMFVSIQRIIKDKLKK